MRKLILSVTLMAMLGACSQSEDKAAKPASACTAQANNEVFKVDCSSTTLEQLVIALQKTGRVEFKYPPELGVTPMSVVAQGQPLQDLLASALRPFNYVVVNAGEKSTHPTQVTIAGIRGAAAPTPTANSNADATAILHPNPEPLPMPAQDARAASDPRNAAILHPEPKPWPMPASNGAAASDASTAAILHPEPRPWQMPRPNAGADSRSSPILDPKRQPAPMPAPRTDSSTN